MAGGRGLLGQFEIKWTQRPNTSSLLLKSSAILQNAFARESLITGKAHFCVLVPINPERFKLSNFIHIIITQDSQNSNKMLLALPLRDFEAGGCGGSRGWGAVWTSAALNHEQYASSFTFTVSSHQALRSQDVT